jgi:cell division topological specificity factor
MIEWVKRLFGVQGSGATAKERLRLVLMTDHLALAPEMIEQMKRDFVEVISRYVEIDREKVEVRFEREDRELAMLASIPILSVTRPNGGNGEESPASSAGDGEPSASVAVETTPQETPAPPACEEQPKLVQSPQGAAPPRRRRRKRGTSEQRPAPASP